MANGATTNLALIKPEVGADESLWGDHSNTNWDTVDGVLTKGLWVAGAGTVDVITATYSPAVLALTDGMLLGFKALGANTTTTPTFAPNGLTARTIVKGGGQALVAGDIPRVNYECLVRYNLASTRWELLNPYEYEEGTWVPADASGAGLTFTGVAARYTRHGRVVSIELVLTYPATVSGANASISGLPYANNSSAYVFQRCRDNASTTVAIVTTTSSATISLVNSLAAAVTNAQMTGSPLIATFHYTI